MNIFSRKRLIFLKIGLVFFKSRGILITGIKFWNANGREYLKFKVRNDFGIKFIINI